CETGYSVRRSPKAQVAGTGTPETNLCWHVTKGPSMKLSDDGSKGPNMDCRMVDEQEIIERYLAERLSEQETEAFEQHYLACSKCFGQLQMRHAAAIELASRPIQTAPARSSWM